MPFSIALVLAAVFGLTCTAQAQVGRINGRVVDASSGIPIENAKVTLDLAPTNGVPELDAMTDPFGFFELKEIPAGEYKFRAEHPHYVAHEETTTVAGGARTNVNIRLIPIDASTFFDVYFQVWCLATHAWLSGSSIVVNYWRPDGALDGLPDRVFNLVTGAAGDVTLAGMVDGFYTFSVTRTGWDPLAYTPPANGGFVTAGNKVRLNRYHYASIFLRPIKQDLLVTAQGYDPVQDKPNQPLKGMTIKRTGVDWVNVNRVLAPVQAALSGEDGTYKFGNLAPIPYKIEVGRLGYFPTNAMVMPDGLGKLPAQTIKVELAPTKVKVVLSSPYRTVKAVQNAKVQLQGLRNSNTEGIKRELQTASDATNDTASATFENLLPGRYWIRVEHQATISGLPNRSGPLFGPDQFSVSFFPQETFAEVTVGVTETVKVQLSPVPARIRGRVFATDEVANQPAEASNPEPNRVFYQKALTGLTFLEHKLIKLLADTNNNFTVDTDAAGGYTILVPPGIFGVQIPSATTYAGHNIEFGNLTAGTPPRAGPWPYPDIWPYNTFEGGHHGAGLRLDSKQEYQLDLFLHRHYINICGFVRSLGAPFGDLILRMNPDGTGVQSIRYDHFWDTGAEIVATGTATHRARANEYSGYFLTNVQAGTYSITVNHPNYDPQPATVTIAPWQPPGVLPVVAPFTPTYFFPGITHISAQFEVKATWKTQGSIDIELYNWVAGDPPFYSGGNAGDPHYFRMTGLPERLFYFRGFEGAIPAGAYTVWRKHGDGWFTGSGAGNAVFKAFEGGPSDNTPPNEPPSGFTAYTLALHAYSNADTNMEISGVTVQFGAGSSRPAGGEIAHEGSPRATGATHNLNQWVYSSSETILVNAATRLVRVNVYMNRAMVVTGLVSSATGPVPGAAVVARNRYGVPIAQGVTGTNGAYNFGPLTPETVYIDVNRRGFIPQRVRKTPPSPENPDISANFTLQSVPSPVIDQFTMNRFGMFLPGVSKSGDPRGFNPEHARDKLTATWKTEARGADYEITLDGFVQANERQGPPEVFQVVDKVVEVWLVDRRAFTNAFVNELNQRAFEQVNPPTPLNYITALNWLGEIVAARKDGKPYFVVHQLVRRGQTGAGNKFEGKLNLWELPSGVLNPRLIAITESGGVAVKDYELPAGKQALQGLNLPQWAATILEVIGVGANFGKFEGGIHAHYGEGFLKIGTVSPVAEGRIGLDPLDAPATADANVTYKYVLGLEMPLGEGTSETGPLNLGPEFLGFKIKGATAEFEVIGGEKKVTLAVVISAGLGEEVEEKDKNYLPVVTEDAHDVEVDVDVEYQGKFGINQTLDSDWLGNNVLASFGFVVEAQGKVDVQVKANATPVLRFIPYVGPVLVTLDKTGALTVKGVFETTLGSKFTVEATTTFPKPAGAGTQVRGAEPARWSLLGSSEIKKEIKLILRIAAGLELSALGGRAEGTALLQLGAPTGVPDNDGIFFTINPLGQGPLITKIEGAFSAVLRVALNLWTVQFQKQWQFDIARFVVDRASEPSFELTPVNITYTIINAASAPQQTFLGQKENIVGQFYPAGSFDVTEGSAPLLVFTGTDPATGEMTVMASVKTGEQWSTPVKLASAGGVISVAAIENSAGGWLVVWTEISKADLGNPYPTSTLKYSTSNAGGTVWSSPVEIAKSAEALFGLKLARAGSQAALLYLSTKEGPLSDQQSLQATVWTGTNWLAPAQLLPAQPIRAYDLAGHTNGQAVAVLCTGEGKLLSSTWSGTNWSAFQEFASGAGDCLAVRAGGASEAFLLWENSTNSLAFSKLDLAAGTWTQLSVPVTNALASDCELLPLIVNGSQNYLLAWTAAGAANDVFYAFVDSLGALKLAPTEATLAEGQFKNLQIRPIEGGRSALVAQFSSGTNIFIRELVLGMPVAGDCDGDGIPDTTEISSAAERDCNRNGIPDSCDILRGTSRDQDKNGIPDECETPPADDCNRNGLSDAHELALGIGDFNDNGVLDDCEMGVQIKTVPLTANVPQRFYRASKIKVKARTATTLELEYEGNLEQADRITGPWSSAP